MGFFPVDEETCAYLKATGRSDEQVTAFRNYFQAQGMFGIPRQSECEYSQVLELDLADVQPSVAGPKRPQDRINLPNLKDKFIELFQKPISENGYNKSEAEFGRRFPTTIGTRGEVAQPLTGGGQQASETAPISVTNKTSAANTSTWTETEMMNNR